MGTIFVSYAHEDVKFSDRLAASLARIGVQVWMDKSGIPGGKKWGEEIQKALDATDLLILVVTPRSNESTYVQAEWQYFLTIKKPVIPIILEQTEVPFLLRVFQHIDFSHEEAYVTAFGQLHEAITQHPGFSDGDGNESPHTEAPHIMDLPSAAGASATDKSVPRIGDRPVPNVFQPLEWCKVDPGKVKLDEASDFGGTPSGVFDLPAFAIARYPVTNGQYEVFIKAVRDDGDASWWDFSEVAKQWHSQNWPPPAVATDEDLPRTNISWYDAVAFCRWISEQAGQYITLPTEQQWQHAAQGNDNRLYPWGTGFTKKLCNCSGKGLTPVTRYENGHSPFGVMDMVGNAWEWCITEWGTGSSDLSGRKIRIVRGGSWKEFNAINLQVTYRLRWYYADVTRKFIGLRLVRPLQHGNQR